jgi:hypothetical protein
LPRRFLTRPQDFLRDSQDLARDSQDFMRDSRDLASDSQDFMRHSQNFMRRSQDFMRDSGDLARNSRDLAGDSQDLANGSQTLASDPENCTSGLKMGAGIKKTAQSRVAPSFSRRAKRRAVRMRRPVMHETRQASASSEIRGNLYAERRRGRPAQTGRLFEQLPNLAVHSVA